MGIDWREYQLGKLAEILSSKRIFASDYVEQGIPFYRSKEIIEKALGQGVSNKLYISKERFNTIKEKHGAPTNGDLLISAVGHRSGIPYCVENDEDFYFKDGNLIWFRNFNNGFSSKYLSYFFNSRLGQHKLESIMIGSAQKALTIVGLKSIKLEIPPIDQQKSIAHILGSLDDKIELNRHMNETIEAMAQNLFKSWFVDFDPIIDNALIAGNKIPDALMVRAQVRQTLGDDRRPLPESIRHLFPDSFEYNDEMGWVPVGWEVQVLSKITKKLRRGISPKYTETDGVRTLNQRCIRNHLINFSLSRQNDETKRKIDGRLIEVGDLLINSTGVGTLGRMAQVLYLDEPTVVDSHVTLVRANRGVYRPYVFARMMLSIEPMIEAMGEGSTGQTELKRANLLKLPVIVPNTQNQDLVEDTFADFAKKIVTNSKQNQKLENLRDTLLPQLLSGKLSIPDAERLVEEVL